MSSPDVDGDGHRDVVVGAPMEQVDRGSVYVISSVDGRVLRILDGHFQGDHFGVQLDAAFDLDGDARPDLLAFGDGVVRSHHGVGASMLRETGVGFLADVGRTLVRVLDDVDGDGFAEWLAGEGSTGRVWVQSGKTSQFLFKVDRERRRTARQTVAFALGLVALRVDLDGDVHRDFAIATLEDPTAAIERWKLRLRLCSGKDGKVLREITDDVCGVWIGSLVAGHDVDGDDVEDLVIGLTDPEGTSSCSASVEIRSGADLHRIHRLEVNGAGVTLVRDLDGDGRAEILVAAGDAGEFGETRVTSVFSGKSGLRVSTRWTPTRRAAMTSLDDDLDGDGVDELLLGLPWSDEVWIVSGRSAIEGGANADWQPLRVLTPEGPRATQSSAPSSK